MRALFCEPVFSIFEFYTSKYASASTLGYQSNLGTMPFSSGIADVPVKRRFKEKLSIILKTILKLIHKLGNNFNGMANYFLNSNLSKFKN